MTESPSRPLYAGPDVTPRPDPTVLTNQAVAQALDQMRREITAAVKLLEAQIQGEHDAFMTRLAANDKAVELLQTTMDRRPHETDSKIEHSQELINQRFQTMDEHFKTVDVQFEGIALQFKERDTRSERESRDNKVAVDAAFAAQKEAASEQNKSNTLAIDKSEKATAETLNKQADLFKSTTDALSAQIAASAAALGNAIADLKERMTRVEGQITSASTALATALATNNQAADVAHDATTVRQSMTSLNLQALATGVALIGLIALLVRDIFH